MKAIKAKATAAALLRARTAASLTQRELARRARTAQSVVARIESGQANPTVETLERLVQAAGFGLRIDIVPKSVPDAVIDAYKRGVDRTMLRENLRRSVDERLAMNDDLLALTGEMRRVGHLTRKRS